MLIGTGTFIAELVSVRDHDHRVGMRPRDGGLECHPSWLAMTCGSGARQLCFAASPSVLAPSWERTRSCVPTFRRGTWPPAFLPLSVGLSTPRMADDEGERHCPEPARNPEPRVARGPVDRRARDRVHPAQRRRDGGDGPSAAGRGLWRAGVSHCDPRRDPPDQRHWLHLVGSSVGIAKPESPATTRSSVDACEG